jgi:hypothetical protein
MLGRKYEKRLKGYRALGYEMESDAPHGLTHKMRNSQFLPCKV